MTLGVRREHIYMFDSKGLIHTGRIDLHATKAQFSQSEDCTLEEALTGADVFLGLSTKGLLTQDMVKLMAPSPSSSPVRTRTRKSPTRTPKRRARTASWVPAVPTGPTR